MGRTRKPLSEQKGNLTVEFKQQREFEEKLATGSTPLSECPIPDTLIDDEAKELWVWAVEQMEQMDLLCSIDTLNLEAMCNAYAMYRKATRQLKRAALVTRDKKANPLIAVQSKYAEEFRIFARLCGFTVDSRLKLAAQKAKELDDEIGDDFGDI